MIHLKNSTLLQKSANILALNERVFIDRHTDNEYFSLIRERFLSLKSPRAPGASLVKSIKSSRSESEVLIQLADMVCGAAKRKHLGDSECFDLIASKGIKVNMLP